MARSVVRALRHARGETLEQLAARVPCSKQYLSLLERGERVPSVRMLHRLAAALGVIDPSALMPTFVEDER